MMTTTRTVTFSPAGDVEVLSEGEAEILGLTTDTTWLVVTRFTHEDYQGVLVVDQDPEGGAALAWHDYVVNAWQEYYPDIAVALVRLALLIRAGEDHTFFVHGPEDFTSEARVFLRSQRD